MCVLQDSKGLAVLYCVAILCNSMHYDVTLVFNRERLWTTDTKKRFIAFFTPVNWEKNLILSIL